MYRIKVTHPNHMGPFTALGLSRTECLEILLRKFPEEDYTIQEEGLLGPPS